MCVCVLSGFSRVWLFVSPWTAAHQAPLSMGFSRQEYWSGLPCPPPGDLPKPGIELVSLMIPTLAAGFFTTSATRKHHGHPNPIHTCTCTTGSWFRCKYITLGVSIKNKRHHKYVVSNKYVVSKWLIHVLLFPKRSSGTEPVILWGLSWTELEMGAYTLSCYPPSRAGCGLGAVKGKLFHRR